MALNFNGDPHGANIVVFTGKAAIGAGGLSADEKRAYLAKYAQDIPAIGHTVASFEQRDATAVRLRPERVRADE